VDRGAVFAALIQARRVVQYVSASPCHAPAGRARLGAAGARRRINHARLYLPDRDQRAAYPLLEPALLRPIRWEHIAQEYDQMMKYATAIRVGTASTEATCGAFTRNATHPTYRAMLEVGRAEKTIFLARYLRDRDLQQDTEGGLNVVEQRPQGSRVPRWCEGHRRRGHVPMTTPRRHAAWALDINGAPVELWVNVIAGGR